MTGECRGYKPYTLASAAWTLLAIASGILGYAVSASANAPLLVGLASLTTGLAGASYIAVNAWRNLRRARALEAYCGCPVYCPRRYSFICRRGAEVLCYNYVTGLYYRIVEAGQSTERRVSPLTPLDYYCVKYLGGRLEEKQGYTVYTGEAEYLAPPHCGVARGRATIILGGDPSILRGARDEE